MALMKLTQTTFRQGERWRLTIDHLTLATHQTIAFIGYNGSGKSTLAQGLSGELAVESGQLNSSFRRPVRLSFEQLSQFLDQEWQRTNSDLFGEDENRQGQLTRDVIQAYCQDEQRCRQLAAEFSLTERLAQPFKLLSTGESRKALLCQALITNPDLLILDEPFDGLDSESRAALQQRLAQLSRQPLALVLIVNRFDQIPSFIERVGILADGQLQRLDKRDTLLAESLITQLTHLEQLTTSLLPAASSEARPADRSDSPLICLKQGHVAWGDKVIISGLDWQVNQGEHWQITGPNGAGKSTLLSLVTGDHPQGYSNDLTLFGIRRGSGETLWEIKRHIGYVSSSLHLDYRPRVSIRVVILSGFYDTIGLYQTPTQNQKTLTQQWLELLGIDRYQADRPFHDQSWGQQRLILIVRALVKHPRLLILDEPLQGLDALNRQLVKRFISQLIAKGSTQLLFVSHHAEDAPDCISHRLSFVPHPQGGYVYQRSVLD